MQLAFNLLGILAVFGICWLLSWQRKSINWKLIGKAFVIQLLLAVFIVKVPLGQQVISILSDGVTAVVNCGKDGVSFVFGDLADTVTAMQEGTLLGQKLALNEFVAFGTLGAYISTLDSRTAMMCAISLAGFANVSSMGICIGGIGALCPEKKGVLSRIVVRAMLGGMLLSILSAMLCGLVALF